MMRIQVELDALSHIPDSQDLLREDFRNSLASQHNRLINFMEARITQMEDKLKSQADSIQTSQRMQMGALVARRRPSSSQQSSHPPSLSSSAASQAIGVRVAQYTSKCRAGCQCACHQQRKASSSFMNRILGQIFVGYAGLPMVSSKCDSAQCNRAQVPVVSVEYWFPLGFCWSKIVQLQLSYRPNIGPQFNLSTLRSVPDTAPCVEYALHGDIEGLKSLFQRGRASPLDVSVTRGYTLVRVRLDSS